MKYKLINTKTKEETICDKVTIDGIDYYVSDELPKLNNVVITSVGNIHYIKDNSKDFIEYISKLGKKIIATNNPNIDIPKVVDEVEIKVDEILNKELPNFTPYHRRSFFLGYNKSQETHPFSEEDMIEFAKWIINQDWDETELNFPNNSKTTKELLQLWKEQQPKIVYYEN